MASIAAAAPAIDPALALLFALARQPSRSVPGDPALRERIRQVKIGYDPNVESKDQRQRSTRKRALESNGPVRTSERVVAERRKPRKRKTAKRCTSPSHFAIDVAEEVKYGPEYTLDLPSRERVDALLRSVASFYFRPREVHPSGASVWVDAEYDQTQYPSLDLLLSPLRRVSPRENWSSKEIAIFEAGICRWGKQFHAIAKLIRTKSTSQVVQFYYEEWKHHHHYNTWKGHKQAEQQVAGAVAAAATGTRAAPPCGASDEKSSAAGDGSVPAALVSSRSDTHARIRMVDAQGVESYFLLPLVGDDTTARVMAEQFAREEAEAGGLPQGEDDERSAGEDNDEAANDSQDDDDAASMEDEPPPPQPASQPQPAREKEERKASVRPAAATAPASKGPRTKAGQAAAAAAAAGAPVPGFKCMFAAVGSTTGRTCGKFFRTTNALGSHLFMTHKMQKAIAGGIEKGYYIQCTSK